LKPADTVQQIQRQWAEAKIPIRGWRNCGENSGNSPGPPAGRAYKFFVKTRQPTIPQKPAPQVPAQRVLKLRFPRTLVFCSLTAFAFAALPAQALGAEKSSKKSRSSAPLAGPLYEDRADAMALADSISAARGLDAQWARQAIGKARFTASVVKAISPPPVGTPKNWAVYRSRFIDPIRVKAGVKFWQAHHDTLQRAEAETGVPAAIVVGIIGVESIFGQQIGTYRVMDALVTLALDFPSVHPKAAARAAFFRQELEEFLVLTARTQTDPLALRGSYAGALGMPQFMPSSWAKYAIDFDGDGRVDLFNSPADVIGSVANYFKAFQWQRGMPTHYPVSFNLSQLDRDALMAPDILPTFTPAEFAAKGALTDSAGMRHTGRLALIELQNGAAPPQYVAGTENFYAITRYNWSSYYAMAVIELGRDISAAMPK
jgi:membrane-bound lytic murein transglycosylase B